MWREEGGLLNFYSFDNARVPGYGTGPYDKYILYYILYIHTNTGKNIMMMMKYEIFCFCYLLYSTVNFNFNF